MHTSEIVLQTLKEGNAAYVKSGAFAGDISPEKRLALTAGQSPRAVVITCADSRVIPEVIFSCGLGELFTIRIAGNVIDAHQLGSIEYAVSHLKTPLVVILGHTGCGAVQAALHGEADGHIRYIVDTIREAIGEGKRSSCGLPPECPLRRQGDPRCLFRGKGSSAPRGAGRLRCIRYRNRQGRVAGRG